MLAGGEDTGVAFSLLETRVLPGGGPPAHVHSREDEAFYALEGEITFQLGDRHVVAGAGAFVQGPRGLPHAFKNDSQHPARLLVLVTPPDFENFIADIATPFPSFDSPPAPVTAADIQKLLTVAPGYGIEILPPQQ